MTCTLQPPIILMIHAVSGGSTSFEPLGEAYRFLIRARMEHHRMTTIRHRIRVNGSLIYGSWLS